MHENPPSVASGSTELREDSLNGERVLVHFVILPVIIVIPSTRLRQGV